MESSLIVALATIIFLSVLIIKKRAKNGTKQMPPAAGGAWPVIGHLHLLGGRGILPHKTLGSLADKYGPIFMMKLGLDKAVVVSDWKMAKECFTTNDKVLCTRPKSLAAELMGYNYAMFGLGPYGSYWREIRKIVLLELLSSRRIELLRHIRESEVKESVHDIYEHWRINHNSDKRVEMEMREWFGELILNIMRWMIVGKRYSRYDQEGKRSRAMIRQFAELLGTFVVSDVIPFLRRFDVGGCEKAMKEIAEEMDDIVEGWLQEHKRLRRDGVKKKGEEEDFMEVMMSIVDDVASKDQFPGYDADTITKATCMAILTAGTDNSSVTLSWALTLLLNDGKALKKIQDELDVHVGRERWVEESDLKNLVYLQAVVKETLRLYPAAPLSGPHQASEYCVVGGYDIPQGTRFIANLWKIQRDPDVYTNPHEFIPERFLTKHAGVEMKGHDFELMPFGSGRRTCPGASLALQIVPLALATLLQGFEVSKTSDELIDMSESFGLSNLKSTPLDVLLAPRLPSNFYG